MQTPDLELYALKYAQTQTEQERAIIFAEINHLIEQYINTDDKIEWQSRMYEITQLMQKGVNNLSELTDKFMLQNETKTKLDKEEIQKMEEALDKKPIGQDKLASAKKLVEKGVLTLENIEKAEQKGKLEKK